MPALWKDAAAVLERIGAHTKRKEITKILGLYLQSLKQTEDLLYFVYLSIARVSSESDGEEMNVGETLILKALSLFLNAPVNALKEKAKESGDISSLTLQKKLNQLPFAKTKQLLLSEVFQGLKEVSLFTGKDSGQKRVSRIISLLARCTSPEESRYIVRILDGKLKIGLSTQTVLSALGLAFVSGISSLEEPEWTEEEVLGMEAVKEAYAQLPSFARLITLMQSRGLSGLSSSLITPGYPLRPMLAMAEKDPASVLERFSKSSFSVEYKYDGERVQAHSYGGRIDLFSRGLEKSTERFSQILQPLREAFAGEGDFIIDGEIVAYDRVQNKILPFQVLSNRKRKVTEHNANKEESDIALFIFDMLYLNKPLTKLSLTERREILKESFNETAGSVMVVSSTDFSNDQDLDALNGIFNQSLASGCEGVMIKSTDASSTYEPSKRSQKWIKLKADYITGMCDTLDLLVIGAYTGKGKRTGVHGGFLLGCFNENGDIETVTKLGTGFSEAQLSALVSEFQPYATSVPVAEAHPSIAPDIWFKPHFVWEIASAGISLSPRYTAAVNSPEIPESRGLSLRFPRFVRKREDKTLDSSTTSSQLLSFFLQSTKQNENTDE
ncbi:DNA ligase 1 [Nematocida displodere]|uniref:DNA ligase n=1 Tax=Nematocida displodere TaxID=1805483 RepID=A0A177ECF8_9MICR|nr:DNA ligase 1 [Nematocida displodere]